MNTPPIIDDSKADPRLVGGKKYDQGKAPLSMLSGPALLAVARVMKSGAEKYGRDNWRKGFIWTRLIDAALRHILAFNEGEDHDDETGESHLAHAMCCLMFLLEFEARDLGEDDRVRSKN